MNKEQQNIKGHCWGGIVKDAKITSSNITPNGYFNQFVKRYGAEIMFLPLMTRVGIMIVVGIQEEQCARIKDDKERAKAFYDLQVSVSQGIKNGLKEIKK